MFPKNTWYVACTSDEVTDKPFARKVCGQDIVFFRKANGQVVGLEDFCPHRGAPLSLGTVEGDGLICGYHGLKMGAEGKTLSMPKQKVDRFPCIKVYPTEERKGFIWIWPGDEALATKTEVPDFEWQDQERWGYGGGLYHIQCDYRLMVDNLMDLTHETYVHATSIGQKEIDEEPVNTTLEDGQVVTSRFMENIMAPPFWQMALKECGLPADEPVDRWQICRFSPPSHIMIEVGVALAGNGGYKADDQYKAATTVVDFITPETETSIWYFWGMARKWRPHDEELTAKIREGQGKIFAEDREMLESQQANLSRYPERKLLKLDIDSGGVRSRNMINRMLKQEESLVS
jgi:vanillate O-demethylase monooxygenase subunit